MRATNQKERLQKLRQGEGTFVYEGGFYDTESVPGVPLLGKDGNQARSVVFKTVEDEEGNKVQIVDPDSGEKGSLVWKKAPRFKRTELEVLKLRIPSVFAEHEEPGAQGTQLVAKAGIDGNAPALWLELPKGKSVFVGDPRMALKLRCMKQVRELVDGDAEAEKPRRGRPAKGRTEPEAVTEE